MTIIDNVAERWLRRAAHRWRDSPGGGYQEWAAELRMIDGEKDRSGLTRGLAKLRYAASLATSPPPRDPHAPPRDWRQTLPTIGRGLLAMVVLAVMAVVLPFVLHETLLAGALAMELGASRLAVYGITTVITLGFFVGVCLLARRLGRAMALPGLSGRFTRVASVGGASLALATGVAFSGQGGNILAGRSYITTTLLWTIAMVVVLAVAVMADRNVKSSRAWTLGVAGSLALVEGLAVSLHLFTHEGVFGSFEAAWWLPAPWLDPAHVDPSSPQSFAAGPASAALSYLLVASLISVGFVLGSNRANVTASEPIAEPVTC
jgi:hypothetical protein